MDKKTKEFIQGVRRRSKFGQESHGIHQRCPKEVQVRTRRP
ncbi:hypothetical protein [Neobacillus vireti]